MHVKELGDATKLDAELGPMTDDERAIRELVATWMEASRTGDTDTVLSLMADDVIFMVAGREPFGKEEFASSSRSMTDLRNRLTITMTPAGGEAMLRRSGYTLSILRKEKDGRWLLVRDANLLAIHD